MMKSRPLLGSLLAAFWTLTCAASWAQTEGKTYHFQGQSFHIKEIRVEGTPAYSLGDPELKKLIGLTSTQVQMSSTGQSLYIFTSGRQTSWSDHSSVYSLNNVEQPAPGKYFGSVHALEGRALWHALGVQASENGQDVELDPVITGVAPSSAGPGITFKTSAPVKFVSSTVSPGHLTCTLESAGWDLSQRDYQVGDVSVKVRGGTGKEPLALEMFFPPIWTGRVHKSLTGDLELSEDMGAGSKQAANLESVTWQPSLAGTQDKALELDFDHPVRYGWCYTPESHLLSLEMSNVQAGTLHFQGLDQVQGDSSPVVRYQLTLQPGQTFAFEESKTGEPKLVLRITSGTGSASELQGLADMPGSQPERGLIVLDPGHGGGDAGCYGRSVGVYEKDITLDICRRLQQLLVSHGWQVVLTREVDRDVTWAGSPDAMELQARADVANKRSADLFVSIHCNASVSSAPHGSAVYWYKEQDYELAQNMDVLGGQLGFTHNGLLRNSFHVLRTTDMPAVLVETAFLTNPEDGRRLASPDVRQAIAERLAAGVDHYFDAHIASRRQNVAGVRPRPPVASPVTPVVAPAASTGATSDSGADASSSHASEEKGDE